MSPPQPNDLVGKTVLYSVNDLPAEEVYVVTFERTAEWIADVTTGETWHGVRFKLRWADGEEHWTCVYPDKARPIAPSPKASTP